MPKPENRPSAPSAEGPKKRKGRKPIAADQRRDHCVSVRLNPAELAKLDAERGKLQRGEAMRAAFLGVTPPPPPAPLNLIAWRELSHAQANLNQLARAVNGGESVEVREILEEVRAFRNALIGVVL